MWFTDSVKFHIQFLRPINPNWKQTLCKKIHCGFDDPQLWLDYLSDFGEIFWGDFLSDLWKLLLDYNQRKKFSENARKQKLLKEQTWRIHGSHEKRQKVTPTLNPVWFFLLDLFGPFGRAIHGNIHALMIALVQCVQKVVWL